MLLWIGIVCVLCILVEKNIRAQSETAAVTAKGSIAGKVLFGEKPVQDAIVYIEKVSDSQLTQPYDKPVVLDQKGLAFVPHVLPVVSAQEVVFRNSDKALHNVHAYQGKKSLFNVAVPAMQPSHSSFTQKFSEPGIYRIRCDIHAEMLSYVVVLENRLFAVSDKKGAFHISGIPPGSYTLKAWHERYKFAEVSTVKVTDNNTDAIVIHLSK